MASIRADMQLNAAPFLAGIARVQTQMRNLQAAAAGITAAFFAVRSTMAGLRSVFDGVKGALDMGGTFSDLAASTGASVGELVLLTQAFQNNGLAAEQVGPMIARFQRALGGVNEDGKSTADVLQKLGVNTLALGRMNVVGQFTELSRAFSAIEDPAVRTRRAMELFGRSGATMLTLFRDSEAFTRAASEIGSMGEVLEENATRFDSMSDALTTLGKKMDQFFVGAMASMGSGDALEKAAQADFTAAGRSAGAVASALGEWMAPLSELNDFMTTKVPLFTQIRQAVEQVISPKMSAAAADNIGRQSEQQVGGFDARVRSVASEDERSQVMDDLSAAIDAARDRLDNLDQEFSDLRPQDRIDPQNAITDQIVLLERQRMILSDITPEILAANAAEAERAAALAQSAAAAAKLAAQLDKALEGRDVEAEKLILSDLAPADAEARVLSQVATPGKTAELVLSVTGLPDIEAAQAALDAINSRAEAEAQLRTVGLPNAAEMIKILDTASGKTVELALEATGLPDAEALRAAIDGTNAKAVDLALEATGLSDASALRAALDATDGKQIELALQASGLPDANALRQAIDSADDKTIALALEATGLTFVGELRAALDGVPDKTITMALQATGAANIEELRARLDAAPDEKTVEMILRATGTEDIDAAKAKLAELQQGSTAAAVLQVTGLPDLEAAKAALDAFQGKTVPLSVDDTDVPEEKTVALIMQALGVEDIEAAKAKLDAMQNGTADITITSEGVTAEIERLRALGAETTDAEKARLVELIEAEKALLSIKQRATAEDAKRAEQAERLAATMQDMALEADAIVAEAAGDTARVREIEVEKSARSIAKRLESDGMDPADAAQLARAKAEADSLRQQASSLASPAMVQSDAQRSIGLGGIATGPSVDAQRDMVKKQDEANRKLERVITALEKRTPVMLAEVFD